MVFFGNSSGIFRITKSKFEIFFKLTNFKIVDAKRKT